MIARTKNIFLSFALLGICGNISAMKQETSQEMSKRFERERDKERVQNAKANQTVNISPHADFTTQLAASNHNINARHNQFMQNQQRYGKK